MTTEFNLSEKIEGNDNNGWVRVFYLKEFIKILLDTYEGLDENWIQKSTIIKFAGDKLK